MASSQGNPEVVSRHLDQREVRAQMAANASPGWRARAEDRRLPNGHRNLPAASYPTIIR